MRVYFVLVEQVHHYLDCFLELRVVALAPKLGIQLDFEVRLNAVILHVPLTVGSIEGQVGRTGESVIDQVNRVRVVADESAPGSLTHQRPDSRFPEEPRHGIAAGASHFVGDHHLGTENRFYRRGDVFPFPHVPVTE